MSTGRSTRLQSMNQPVHDSSLGSATVMSPLPRPLLRVTQTLGTAAAIRYSDALEFPGYPWQNNSCWLDTALQALFVVLLWDEQAFAVRFETQVSSQTVLYDLYRTLDSRLTLHRSHGPNNTPTTLQELRNQFRGALAGKPSLLSRKKAPLQHRAIIASTTDSNNIFVSDTI